MKHHVVEMSASMVGYVTWTETALSATVRTIMSDTCAASN